MIRFQKPEPIGDLSNIDELIKTCHVSPLVAELLCRRGHDTFDQANIFLHPTEEQLLSPEIFENMEEALDCLYAAKAMEDIICVYGDYDVDGTSATAILLDYFHRSGFRVRGYIPSRHEEGYGLNREAITRLAEEGVNVIVTVDCGITALDEIRYAQELGLEVIVTDHHQRLEELPECAAILNPQVSIYPNKALCGAGVALKLVQAMGGKEAASQYYDIAALATVSDIVDLTGENRAIVALGLQQIHQGKGHDGLKALMEVNNLDEKTLDAQDFAFYLGPCLNAAGRLANAKLALQLLISNEADESKKIARKLSKINTERKEIEATMYRQVIDKIESGDIDLLNQPAILLQDDTWNAGLIGIVAARLMRAYYKPVFLFAGDSDYWVGSGRSIKGIHLFQMLQPFAECFERYGGHAMAAGLSIKKDQYDDFCLQFQEHLNQEIPKETFIPIMNYDVDANMDQLTMKTYKELQQLAPFGTGNDQPIFYLKNLQAESAHTMGQDKTHLKMQKNNIDFVAFNQAHYLLKVQKEEIDILATLGVNTWKGKTSLQVMVRAISPKVPANVEAYIDEERWRFAYAFYQQLTLNKSDMVADQVEITQDEAREMIRQRFGSNPQGTLVVCNTPQTAESTLKWLQTENLLPNIDILWGLITDIRAYNCVLLAPLFKETSYVQTKIHYDSIFWMDGAISLGHSLDYVQANEIWRVHALVDEFQQEIAISREDLIPIYQAMRALSLKKQVFLDEESYYEAIAQYLPASRYLICASRFIFEQLELISIEEGAEWTAKIVSNAEKKDLEESTVFEFCRRFKNC